MKILCLQLARFGDIFMTWPVLRALRRQHPEAQIHGMFRERFVEAARIGEPLDLVIEMPSKQIFSKLLIEQSVDGALACLSDFINQGLREEYDLIINFSFSPLSSYLVNALKSPGSEILGYQRHSDGFLNLADDVSRYFYAQVGTHQFNRIHVTELMAMLANLHLLPEDSNFKSGSELESVLKKFDLDGKGLVCFHLGASENHKRLSPQFWQSLILQFKVQFPEFSLVLIGSKEEAMVANYVEKTLHSARVINLAGRTEWRELKEIFSVTRLFVGADSGPMHLAGMMQAPVLNLSVGEVNFWETGPRAPGGHVLRASDEQQLSIEEIVEAGRAMAHGGTPQTGHPASLGTPSFLNSPETFDWQLVQAVYMDRSFPSTSQMSFVKAVQDLNDLNFLALKAITQFSSSKLDFLGPYLDRIYESMNLVGKAHPSVSIFVNWLRAEKCSVPPSSPSEICQSYYEIHLKMKRLLNPYVLPYELSEGSTTHG